MSLLKPAPNKPEALETQTENERVLSSAADPRVGECYSSVWEDFTPKQMKFCCQSRIIMRGSQIIVINPTKEMLILWQQGNKKVNQVNKTLKTVILDWC